jgi:predicted MFS family arabinose efflux permease
MDAHTTTPSLPGDAHEITTAAPWLHIAQAAAALAAAMGVGRFVYTPILPMMTGHAGLSASAGASLATANYIGYLVGALAPIVRPALAHSRLTLRAALVTVALTLALMPATHAVAAWWALRLITGAASALVFVVAAGALLHDQRRIPAHRQGWGMGGVGGGIALSGIAVLIVGSAGDWRTAWWAAAALAAALGAAAWTLRPSPAKPAPAQHVQVATSPSAPRGFGILLLGYSLEGVGYIIAGTFLVAAIEQTIPGPIGSSAWILVGLAAIPSSAMWTVLSRRWSRTGLLTTALLLQAAGVALPALSRTVPAAVVAAIMFGGTFVGVSALALATGTHLRIPRSVAVLTAGYSLGQILGPLLVTPLLRHGYQQALLIAAVVLVVAAAMTAFLRLRGPIIRTSAAADATAQ